LQLIRPYALVLVAVVACATEGSLGKPHAHALEAARTVRIFATSDEHGWLEPAVKKSTGMFHGGMAHLQAQLVAAEGFSAGSALLMSAGDMWTGPYESTVLQGQPMVEVMNAMGYRAAAVGNHEFDFGADVLAKRAQEAQFTLLAANVTQGEGGPPPHFARPFVVVSVAGVKVGVLGLSTLDTPITTDARHVKGLCFGPYGDAVRRHAPAARAAGAEVLVLLAHVPVQELRTLAPELRPLGIAAVIGGHRHVSALEVDSGSRADASDDVLFCNPGPYARSYCKLELTVQSGVVLAHKESIEVVTGSAAQPPHPLHEQVTGLILKARQEAAAKGDEILAEIPEGLRRAPIHTLGYLVVDSWLGAVPFADFAVSNRGGFRQDVEGGPVRVRDVVSAMPFDNYLVVVELTAAQLRDVMTNPQSIAAGLTVEYRVLADGAQEVTSLRDTTGQPLVEARTYRVVVNDFIYRGGDQYRLQDFDSEPDETGLHWREPLLRLLRESTRTQTPVSLAVTPRALRVP
jgi:2',3'-cyclic-nucleotide 2'-phosphodiesterase (5'-nucleotidase family)